MGAAWRSLGGLDTLVNVGGIYLVTPALALDEAEWDRVLDVNPKAPFFCARALASRLTAAKPPGRVLT